MRFLLTVALLALAGCASQDYVSKTYKGIDPVSYSDKTIGTTGQDFYLYDKVAEHRLMMTLQVGGSLMLLVTGANAVPPQTLYEQAANDWFASVGRPCHAVRSTLILMSEYEVEYDCSAKEAGAGLQASAPASADKGV